MPERFLFTEDCKPLRRVVNSMCKSHKVYHATLDRLTTAKKPETRERRILQLLQMMKRGEKLH